MKLQAAFACAVVAAATACRGNDLIWSENLLENPGAEDGVLAPWQTDDPSVVYATTSQSEHSGTVRPHSGAWFFSMAAGPAQPTVGIVHRRLWQDVDVTSYADAADEGNLLVGAATSYQTEDTALYPGGDYAQLRIGFLDRFGGILNVEILSDLLSSPNLVWLQAAVEGAAPAGTRTIRLELIGERRESSYINAFFDDVRLQVAVIPEPITLSLLAVGAVCLVRRRKR